MIRVVEYGGLWGQFPVQADGVTDDGRSVYVRYRWGNLTVEVDGELVFERDLSGEDRSHLGPLEPGELLESELRQYTAGVIEWPPAEDQM